VNRLALALALIAGVARADIDHIPRGYGVDFFQPVDPSWLLSGHLQLHYQSGALRIHGLDNSITELWPGFAQTGPSGTLRLQNQSDGTLFFFDPNDGYPAFRINTVCSANPGGDPENDCVVQATWNCSAGGGLIDPAHWCNGMSIERHFLGGHPQTEMHLKATGTNGIEHRFVSMEGHEDDNSTSLFLAASTVNAIIGADSGGFPVFSSSGGTNATIVSSPGTTPGVVDVNNVTIVHGSGSANTVTATASDGTHVGSLIVSGDGSFVENLDAPAHGCLTAPGVTGINGCMEYWDSNGNMIISSADGYGVVNLGNGAGPQISVNGSYSYFFQPNQFFVSQKLIYQQHDALGTSTSAQQGILLRNTTAATSGATRQFSPDLQLTGYGWTGSANRAVSFKQLSEPDGSGGGAWHLMYSSDEGNYSDAATVDQAGNAVFPGSVTASSFVGTHSEKYLHAYDAADNSTSNKLQQWVVTYASTLADVAFTTSVVGVGGGNYVVKLCSDGATCSGSNLKATCTVSCTAVVGTATACTVNNASVAAASTLTLQPSTACATTAESGNFAAHLTQP
jgi:hypothetical protein